MEHQMKKYGIHLSNGLRKMKIVNLYNIHLDINQKVGKLILLLQNFKMEKRKLIQQIYLFIQNYKC